MRKWIKKFENFSSDGNRDSTSVDYLPKYNPITIRNAEEYVDYLSKKDYTLLFKIAGMDMREVNSSELDSIFDIVKEKAVEYFIDNPQAIDNEKFLYKVFKVNGGDGISRVQNIGGTSHANSRIVGESKNFDDEVRINPDEMTLFDTEEPLIQLIRGEKITLQNGLIKFSSDDKETIDILDIYFEI